MFFNPLFMLFKLLFGVTVIKSPLAFLQKQGEVFGWDAIKSSHVAFGLVPKVLNPVDMVLPVGKQL